MQKGRIEYVVINTQSMPLAMYPPVVFPAMISVVLPATPVLVSQPSVSLEGYCLCATQCENPPVEEQIEKLKKSKLKSKSLKKEKYEKMFRERANCLVKEISTDLEKNKVKSEDIYILKGTKPAQSFNIKRPENRSEYIGVAKNVSKWQTLVCTRNDKIFLGNYDTEEQAAKVVDFYSIVVKRDRAKVNQVYTVGEVKHMLDDYIANEYTFNCNNFL